MKPIPLTTICDFLGKNRNEANQLVIDGLPVVKIPAKTKPIRKVPFSAFYEWFRSQSEGTLISYDGLKADLLAFIKDKPSTKKKEKSATPAE